MHPEAHFYYEGAHALGLSAISSMALVIAAFLLMAFAVTAGLRARRRTAAQDS